MKISKKILLVQLYSNGDCLYATTVARQIKTDYPECKLIWAIASSCKNIIANNEYVNEIWEIPDVNKENGLAIYRRLKRQIKQQQHAGYYYKVFFTQIIDNNLANYDGCIRSAIFRGYERRITVPITPVLHLYDTEIAKVASFAKEHKLNNYKNVILFEFAPQSGQVALTPELAINLAHKITQTDNTAIILSSNIKVNNENKKIIDGSTLSLRETAALTHYCTLLLGCSSGITWVSTSDAAKLLPMVQILDPYAYWVNSVKRDFERFRISTEELIELYEMDVSKITSCISEILNINFQHSKKIYDRPLPLQFKTTRRSIYNMLCHLQLGAIVKHIRINIIIFGWHWELIKNIILGFGTAPFILIKNIILKKFIYQVKQK